MDTIERIVWRAMSWFWILSPAGFCVLRYQRLFDFSADWLIFGVLALISWAAMYCTFKRALWQ